MSSGYPGGADFYNSAGIGGGSAAINNGQALYRSQLGGILLDGSSTTILPRRTDMVAKRHLSELDIQYQLQQRQQQQQQRQQEQQLGAGAFFRSVKQRSYRHAPPISPISPFDFSPPDVSGAAALAPPSTLSGRYGVPLLQQLRSHSINSNNNNVHHRSNIPSLPGLSFNNCLPPNNNRAVALDSEPESEKKMRNQLQELEKQLLDDIDEDEEDAGSVITNSNSEWSETVNLITTPIQNQKQKPLSPSPTSSSSSSSSSSASPYSCSSKQSLLDAATAISEGKMEAATATLARLKQVSNRGGDPEQRLTAYMVCALQSRGNPTEYPPPVAELGSNEQVIATQMLYEASPCFKLGFMAANLAILEATRDQPNNVHVVDFDIGQGSQYMTLIHALAERQSGRPIVVKITAVVEPGSNNYNEDGLRVVGEWLKKLAERVGVNLKFNAVCRKMADLDRDALESDADEALAVNFAFRLYRMPDESVSTENPRDHLLRVVKGLCPRVVTLVEQEMNANTAPFGARVAEACAYYGALFDSLDATMARDGGGRVRVEECLGRKAANTVACEGRERVERCEVFGKWRARMGMAGFESRPLSQQMTDSLRAKLSGMTRNNPGFTIKQEGGGICFGWMGRLLTVASAWR
ncbi:scarecrow-like protein 8 [Macadamia integrifolia]|uniref:scarecrow-like protein 8 n=1 Tax=Macadamia integrifolia TaxID=60698 RepID=UPI001C528B67|nr:scarecrow-like protein 8 [Macadamia integrifolia]